jgi:hypothetical protein
MLELSDLFVIALHVYDLLLSEWHMVLKGAIDVNCKILVQ